MDTVSWPSEWLRGVLTLLVLEALSHGPTYGYAVATALESHGFGKVRGGTLYPLLSRLESDALVASRWEPGAGGPGRKYFALTAAGHEHLEREVARWGRFSDLVGQRLTASSTPATRRGTP